MFNTDAEKRSLAKAIVHYVYRNTPAVEDSHSDGIVMDDAFYRKIYKSVYNKMFLVQKYNGFYCQIENSNQLKNFLSSQKLDKPLEFLSYGQNISHNFIYGKLWDKAELIEELPKTNLTSYILSGKFKQYCKEKREFDDNAMRDINKDIYNRIYTLLLEGYLE